MPLSHSHEYSVTELAVYGHERSLVVKGSEVLKDCFASGAQRASLLPDLGRNMLGKAFERLWTSSLEEEDWSSENRLAICWLA